MLEDPIVLWLSIQGCIGCFVLSALWLALGIVKRRAMRRPPVKPVTVDPVVLILPICGPFEPDDGRDKWNAQLTSDHAGPLHAFFVIESVLDPAHASLRVYLEERFDAATVARLLSGATVDIAPSRTLTVCISGLSYHGSQKIHNMLFGVDTAAARLPMAEKVLFVDDDVRPHPGTVPLLAAALDEDGVEASTGYSVEVPVYHKRWPPFVDSLIMLYRSVNLLGFLTEKTMFLWGGCLCTRRAVLDRAMSEYQGIPITLRDVWTDGGYSDDMLLGNLLHMKRVKFLAPHECMFVNPLPPGHTFRRSYVNFVRRQFFVLDTYACSSDRAATHIALLQLVFFGILFGTQSVLFLAQLVYVCVRFSWTIAGMLIADVVGYLVAAASLNFLTGSLVDLANSRSGRPPVRPALLLVYTGLCFIIHSFLIPILAISVLAAPTIRWGVVWYTKRRGKVVKVHRFNRQGEMVTHPPGESIACLYDTGAGMPDDSREPVYAGAEAGAGVDAAPGAMPAPSAVLGTAEE